MMELQVNELFGKGDVPQRLMGVVLLGELVSPQKASTSIQEIQTKIGDGSLAASEANLELIHRIEQIESARIDKHNLEALEEWPSIQQLLPSRLGWVGRLALVPQGSPDPVQRTKLLGHARRTVIVIVGVFIVAVLAAGIGFVLQVVWWFFALNGRLTSGIGQIRGNSAIYAETFAVWLALYIGISVLLRSLPLPKLGLIWILVPQIGSLAALVWPVIRGIRWSDVRSDIGLSLGSEAWSVPFIGVGTYLAALPVVFVAMIVTVILMLVSSHFAGSGDTPTPPVHPIVEPILKGTWAIRWQLVFIAVFAAVPEEIMFRGVLYRHLREAGKRFGYIASVAFAAAISSFVFAAIHPQGLLGIPILMSLAIVFSIAREWRGSLVPCMIAHAMVNAGTSSILLLIAD